MAEDPAARVSEIEMILRSLIYAISAVAICAGCYWWGWEQRGRLALKLEYFRVGNQRWIDYDEELKRNKGKHPRAEMHAIGERQGE